MQAWTEAPAGANRAAQAGDGSRGDFLAILELFGIAPAVAQASQPAQPEQLAGHDLASALPELRGFQLTAGRDLQPAQAGPTELQQVGQASRPAQPEQDGSLAALPDFTTAGHDLASASPQPGSEQLVLQPAQAGGEACPTDLPEGSSNQLTAGQALQPAQTGREARPQSPRHRREEHQGDALAIVVSPALPGAQPGTDPQAQVSRPPYAHTNYEGLPGGGQTDPREIMVEPAATANAFRPGRLQPVTADSGPALGAVAPAPHPGEKTPAPAQTAFAIRIQPEIAAQDSRAADAPSAPLADAALGGMPAQGPIPQASAPARRHDGVRAAQSDFPVLRTTETAVAEAASIPVRDSRPMPAWAGAQVSPRRGPARVAVAEPDTTQSPALRLSLPATESGPARKQAPPPDPPADRTPQAAPKTESAAPKREQPEREESRPGPRGDAPQHGSRDAAPRSGDAGNSAPAGPHAAEAKSDWSVTPQAAAPREARTAAPAGAPERPAPAPELPQPAQQPAGHPARQISLQLSGEHAQRVDVRMVERGGEVAVSVRTPDEALARSLRGDLGSLTGKLAQSGFGSETWAPTRPDSSASSGEHHDGGGSRGGRGDSPQQGGGGASQHHSREREGGNRPDWVEELENSFAPQKTQRSSSWLRP